ncbi:MULTISPECIES: hypothetical protein [unclassified Aeromonas]|nr:MULTISPECIES: hypothetical protein [unclassified Aeromonas]
MNPLFIPLQGDEQVLPQLRVGTLELAHIRAIAHQVEQKVRDIAK